MTLYIYSAEGFDDGEFNMIDEIHGDDNIDCETTAEVLYNDPDLYRWCYAKKEG